MDQLLVRNQKPVPVILLHPFGLVLEMGIK